jgi:zinc protease
MFKGTEKYNKANGGHLDAQLGNIGARINASTWLDRTNYFENIPSNYLELAIDIESDRMRNLLLKKEDKDAEMTVVRNEYERGENSPFSSLNKEIWAAAFQAHPYHHSTIGWKSDIENVPMEDLRDFYNTFYWPNNAVVTIIGDFKTEEALSLLQKYYGKIPSSPNEIPELYTEEPEQEGPRRVELNRAGQLGVVGIGHKIPEGSHPDIFSAYVLDYILAEGKTSRLYRAMVDQGKAVNVFNFAFGFRDPSLFVNYVFLSPGTTHEEGEKILLDEIEKIKNEGVTEEEVSRAVNKIVAETAYGRDGSFSIASQLNEAIAMGDWNAYVNYSDNIKNVTPEDVQNFVKKYFVKKQRTTGYFIPKTAGGESTEKAESSSWFEEQTKNYYRTPSAEVNAGGEIGTSSFSPLSDQTSIAQNIDDIKISGIHVLTSKTSVKDVVTFRGSFAAGDNFSPAENAMVADLTGSMLDKGTTKNDKFTLAGKLENMGASINFSVSTHQLNFSGKCLKKDVSNVIELLAEQLRYPAFSEEEFEKLKTQRAGSMKQLLDNTGTRAEEKMNAMIFPETHPNHQTPVSKMIDDIGKVTLKDVQDFHKEYYGPKSMIFVLVGDIDNNEIEDSIEKYFDGWQGGIEYPNFDMAELKVKGVTEIVKMEDKTSATLRIGQITKMKKSDKDYIAFDCANQAFGGGSFIARLMSIIRDEEGLTYGIYAGHTKDIFSDGTWYIAGTFSPDLLHKGYSSTMRELKRWVNEGITEEELKNTKSRMIGSYKIGLSTTGGLAGQILSFAERGYSPSYLDEYPKLVDALTLKEVNSVIKKYIDPEAVVTVAAGTITEKDLAAK